MRRTGLTGRSGEPTLSGTIHTALPQHRLLHPSFDLAEVAASILIAAIASYAALTLARRVGARRGREHLAWLIWGGAAMGLGIGAMHVVRMLTIDRDLVRVTTDASALATTFGGPLFTGRELSLLIAGVSVVVSVVVLVGAIVGAFIDQNARHLLHETQLALEHRAAEHEAEAVMATELYRLLAEHATDMTSTHRPDGRFDYAAPSWADLVGIPANEIIGRLPAEFAHADDVALLVSNHMRGLKSHDVITTLWRCRAGAGYAWLETTTRPVRDAATGRVQTFVCSTRDVTERKRMEEQLARSEARFRAASEGSIDAFFVLEAVRDHHGQITDFVYSELNHRAEALIARTKRHVLGRTMTDVFPKTARTNIAKLARVVESGTPYQEEVEYKPASRPARWLHHQIIPLGDGVAVTSRDISDRKHAEEELRAMTLVDDLTGLYNRRGFRMLAEQHLRLVKRGGPISLLVAFDLDDFKRVNDVHGHAEGDAALRRVASILRTAFRDSDIIARFGGDEFVVLALDCGDMKEQLLARVDAAVAAHNEAAARQYSLSLSLGTARLDPFAPVTLDVLMAAADAGLYEAKRQRAMSGMMA